MLMYLLWLDFETLVYKKKSEIVVWFKGLDVHLKVHWEGKVFQEDGLQNSLMV